MNSSWKAFFLTAAVYDIATPLASVIVDQLVPSLLPSITMVPPAPKVPNT